MPFDAGAPRPNRRADGAGRPASRGRRGTAGAAARPASAARRAGGEIAQRRLQLLLRGLQLARELRVQIAPAVDVADEVAARLRGALRRRPARFRAAARERRELRAPRLERRARRLRARRACAACVGDAIAIELGERGDRARRLAEAPQVGRREQQAQIARLAELVDLDEPRRSSGAAARADACSVVHPRRWSASSSVCTCAASASTLLELLGLDLPLDLELAQVAEQRALLATRGDRLRAAAPAGARWRAAPAPRSARDRPASAPRPRHEDRRRPQKIAETGPVLRGFRAELRSPQPLEDRLAIDIDWYRHAEVLQHRRRDVDDVGVVARRADGSRSACPGVCL